MARHSALWAGSLASCLLYLSNAVHGSFLGDEFEFLFWQTAIVAKSWLYLDGGEIWALPDANATASVAYWNENTYAINLNSFWSTSSVVPHINSKSNGISVTRQPDAFYDANGDKIYSLGGSSYVRGGSYLTVAPKVEIQAFSTDKNDGSAAWEVPTSQGLQPISMPAGNIKATGPDAHWSIGGYTSYITSKGYEGRYAASSMIEYNMTTQQFTNTTLPEQRHLYGQGEYIPIYGKKGAIVFFGGMSGTSRHVDSTFESVSMQEISIYDVETKKFYKQKTRGPAIPTGRSSFCTVAAGQSDNGTYEIVVYGGQSRDMDNISDATYDDLKSVWILTLPAFTWVRGSVGPSQRSQNSCTKLNDNLMISVGGWIQDSTDMSTNTMGGAPDPLPNGLGILDLSSLEWVSDYTPGDPSVYTQPKIVRDVYATANKTAWAWDDEGLKSMFMTENKAAIATSSASSTPAAGKTAAADSEAAAEKNSPTPISVIVGGAVGGVVALALIGLLIFCLLRRRKAAANPEAGDKLDGDLTPELESPHNALETPLQKAPQMHEAQGDDAATELWTESHYHEVPGGMNEVHEIYSVTMPGVVYEAGDGTPRGA